MSRAPQTRPLSDLADVTPGVSRAPRAPLMVLSTVPGLRVCGHADAFKILKGEPTDNMARRRQKWEGKRCQACVKTATERAMAEAKTRRGGLTKCEARLARRFRLPDGSTFAVTYRATDAEHGRWAGALQVPGCAPLAGESAGVHLLLRTLGQAWRDRQHMRTGQP